MADAFQKFGDSMNRAITKISVKTSSSLEKSKIKLHIDTLNKDIQKMLSEIGKEAYTSWANSESFGDSLYQKLEAVKQKHLEIEQLSAELNSIDARDNEILGSKTETDPKPEVVLPQNPCCPNCGYQHEPTAKFCRKCGQKLQ